MTMLRRVRVAGLILLAGLPAPWSALSGQRLGSITGTVRSAAQGPLLEGARVVLVGTTLSAVTSRRGEFAFHGLTPGKYTVKASAIGYATLSTEVEVKPLETLEIEFQTDPESARLPDLTVAEKPNLPAEFVRRSESGGGRYISRADIERRPGITLGNLLRSFPGLRVDCRRYPCTIQQMRARRSCPMAYWIDGVPADPVLVMLQPASELDGVEVYSGLAETPPELYQPSTCGAIVLWSRTPPPGVKKEKKPKPER